MGENNYPQVFFRKMQIHCQRKEVSRFINDETEIMSNDSDKEASDKESSNECDKDTSNESGKE